jgi:CRP/FNR family transcriptional regulator, cyclic AMP receptor protein
MISNKLTWPTEATVYGAQIPLQPRGLMRYWDQVTPSDWADVLATFPVFSGVANRRLRKLVRHARIAEYGPGDIVVEQGSPGDSLYLILSGSAKVRGKPAARPLGIGDYFGELGLLDGVPRSATVVATGELQVMRIPRRSFLSLARRYPAISLKMASNLGRQLRRLEAQPA